MKKLKVLFLAFFVSVTIFISFLFLSPLKPAYADQLRSDIASGNNIGGLVYMHLSTGSDFDNQTWEVAGNLGLPGYTWVADFNGDGKSDIASASATGNKVYMALSIGSDFDNKTWHVPLGQWGLADYTWVGDFNGDGKSDIASADGNNVYMHLSTGSRFDNQSWEVAGNLSMLGYTWVGDFNGDGKSDIASAKKGNVYMALSTGSNFDNQT